MENNSKYPKYSFEFARAMMINQWPMIKIQEDDFIEQAYYIWKQIGNYYSNAHIYTAKVTPDNKLDLPGNVDSIKQVTFPKYLYNINLNNIMIFSGGSLLTNRDILDKWDSYRVDSSITSKYGQNITFRQEDGYLTFDQGDFKNLYVSVLYDGLIVDEDCMPKIFFKEVLAIANNVAFNKAQSMIAMGDPSFAQLISLMMKESDRSMAAARVAEGYTANQWDQILDIRTSYDRKHYNRNFKKLL